MSSTSKRPGNSRPQLASRPGAKKVKFTSVTFSGSRAQLNSRTTRSAPRESEHNLDSHTFHFNPLFREQQHTGSWQVPPSNEHLDSLDESELPQGAQFDVDEDLEDVVLSSPPTHGGKVNMLVWF
ncbi:hypothetical protein FS749_005933 [Ceratobasidium sp. UAMH 11750]|nr:hypothetical protein FS749_005933 [Ceratobasidium sp. UAMH 11750]